MLAETPTRSGVIIDRNDVAGSPFHKDFSWCAAGQQRRVNTGVPTGEKQGIRFLLLCQVLVERLVGGERSRYESAALHPGYGAQWVPWVGGELQPSTGIRWALEPVLVRSSPFATLTPVTNSGQRSTGPIHLWGRCLPEVQEEVTDVASEGCSAGPDETGPRCLRSVRSPTGR